MTDVKYAWREHTNLMVSACNAMVERWRRRLAVPHVRSVLRGNGLTLSKKLVRTAQQVPTKRQDRISVSLVYLVHTAWEGQHLVPYVLSLVKLLMLVKQPVLHVPRGPIPRIIGSVSNAPINRQAR